MSVKPGPSHALTQMYKTTINFSILKNSNFKIGRNGAQVHEVFPSSHHLVGCIVLDGDLIDLFHIGAKMEIV